MNEMMNEAGPISYVVIAGSLLGWVVALAMLSLAVMRTTVRPALVAAGAVLGIGFAVVLIGAYGEFSNVRGGFKAVAHAAPEDRPIIMEGVRREARQATRLGAFGGGPLIGLALAVMTVAFFRPSGSAS